MRCVHSDKTSAKLTQVLETAGHLTCPDKILLPLSFLFLPGQTLKDCIRETSTAFITARRPSVHPNLVLSAGWAWQDTRLPSFPSVRSKIITGSNFISETLWWYSAVFSLPTNLTKKQAAALKWSYQQYFLEGSVTRMLYEAKCWTCFLDKKLLKTLQLRQTVSLGDMFLHYKNVLFLCCIGRNGHSDCCVLHLLPVPGVSDHYPRFLRA